MNFYQFFDFFKGKEKSIYVEISDSKERFGECYVNWIDCLKTPTVYMPHKAFLLRDKKTKEVLTNKFYMNVRWIPED